MAAPFDEHRLRLEDELACARIGLGSDAALVLISPRSGLGAALVSADGPAVPSNWAREEVIRVTPKLPRRVRVLRNVRLRSQQGGAWLGLSSALSVPIEAGPERGWIVIGIKRSALEDIPAEPQRSIGRLTEAYELRRAREREQLYGQVNNVVIHFYRAIADLHQLSATIRQVVVAARELTASDAAYLSLPLSADENVFAMRAFVNVRTADFRNLAIRHGEGQGGLARKAGRSILVRDYLTDPRLRNAPLDVVRREGFRSAIATPLIVDGTARGCLYVANRGGRTLSEDDADGLSLFAQHVGPVLDSVRLKEDIVRLEIERDRERLACELHGTVMRSLVEIAFEADALAARHRESRFSAIAQTARKALDCLRVTLANQGKQNVRVGRVDDIGIRLCAIVEDTPLRLRLDTTPNGRLVRGNVIEAIAEIAQEAVRNAELHSGGAGVALSLTDDGNELRLVIDDDGTGLAKSPCRSGHFGILSMYKHADAVGGRVMVDTSDAGGVRVTATIPM